MIDPEQEKYAKNRQAPIIDALNAFELSLGAALQSRCIPGVVDRRLVSADGGSDDQKNDATPGYSGGCVVSCHPLSQGDKVEAAGIEPASRDISMPASTCVAVFLVSSASRQSAGCSTD
jgi:hypothetical protein